MPDQPFDMAVVGGGINGCGIARDAAGRGASVLLCEMGDLGGATSSASTKLIHGGLRYLEYYEFRLVREALAEREVLLAMAPHVIRPLRFVLPHRRGMRPDWLIRVGLFLYDHLGRRERLPGARAVDLGSGEVGRVLRKEIVKGFEYSDCWVDDSRLVILNAVDAAERGAAILPRVRCRSARREGDAWVLETEDVLSGRRRQWRARVLVNAAGPWVSRFLDDGIGGKADYGVRLVKGSHIIVPRIFSHDRAYIFQNDDGRVVFAIPYEDVFTLIGTTDEDFDGDPGRARISPDETRYLCAAVNAYFEKPVTPADVVHSYSGVRPLYDDGASKALEATRDYVLTVDAENGAPPLLNVYGGKLTTYRRLAEHAIEKLRPFLPGLSEAWTGGSPLPGGDFAPEEVEEQTRRLRARYGFLDPHHARRLVRAYGTRAGDVLGDARRIDDLGRHFGAELYEREVAYLMEREWAISPEDVLWRRTKQGLHMTGDEASALGAWMKGRAVPSPGAPARAACAGA